MLTDADHIRNLLGRYCACIDAADFDGVGALFAHGELAAGDEDAPAFVTGAGPIAEFYGRGSRIHEDGTLATKHVVANSVFASPEADGRVVVRSSYVVHQAAKGFPLQPIIAGRYVDTFVQQAGSAEITDATLDGGWHFVRRHFAVDLMGDLSHHWSGPT